jgi:hypothetical protein
MRLNNFSSNIYKLPYMSWATFEQYCQLHRKPRSTERGGSSTRSKALRLGNIGHTKDADDVSVGSSLHVRRTLDQFYYPALDDTSDRDADQTVSKWSGKGLIAESDGRARAVDDSLLIIVDQLWCWVIDEGTFSLLEITEPLHLILIHLPLRHGYIMLPVVGGS